MAKNMDMVSSRTKIKVSTGYRVFQVCNTILMILVCVITLYPFLYLVAQSFSSESAIVQGLVKIWPVDFNLTTYKSVISKGDFIRYYGNTILYAVIGTLGSLLFSAMLAYPLSKPELRLNKIAAPLIIFTMYFGGGMIPNYVLMTYLGLRDTVAAFILPGLIGTYYVLLMKSFFAGIPRELEEAGSIDGLTHIGIFFKIVLPLSKAALASIGLMFAVTVWNDYSTVKIYITNPDQVNFQYQLRNMIMDGDTPTTQYSVSQNTLFYAAIVCAILPFMALYPFLQKYFVKGVNIGAVKE